MTRRPNIVIFNPDHYRADVLGHAGNPAAVTPNLDRMVANDGVSFGNAFCQNPVCTPSRCSFMTGWYPHVHGHRTLHHMLQSGEPVLMKTLKDNGYFVWWGGKNDMVAGQHGCEHICDIRYKPDPSKLASPGDSHRGEPGSDTYYSFFVGKRELPPGRDIYPDSDWANVLGAVDFIKHAPTDKPLCIVLTLNWPHPFYRCEEPFFSMIDRARMPPRIPAPADWSGKPSILRGLHKNYNMGGWTEDRWRELRAVAYAMSARVDHQFGLVMQALRDAGMYDDTAVFFFSDHGEFLGDYGLVSVNQNTFEDSLTNVPLIVKPPTGVAVKPGVRDCLVELVDFPATVHELAGIEPGYTHFGRSLLPVIAGKAAEIRDAVFCEGGRLENEPHCTERESSADLEPTGHYWPRVSLQQRQPEHTKAVMCRTRDFKYVRRLYESDELYDLRSDPQELHNRIGDPALARELARL
ncbi:MAG: arylsulfatase, partial [Verrucomicrobia bacterium]|nr:arylsulfatase [Verrucomicrobiota bacterium]